MLDWKFIILGIIVEIILIGFSFIKGIKFQAKKQVSITIPNLNYTEDIKYLNENINFRIDEFKVRLNLANGVSTSFAIESYPFSDTSFNLSMEIYRSLSDMYKANLMKYMTNDEIITYICRTVYIRLTNLYHSLKLGSPITYNDIVDDNKQAPVEIANKIRTSLIDGKDMS